MATQLGRNTESLAPQRPSKSISDFTRALARRWWIVLILALMIGGGGTAFTLHQRPVYQATSRILIEPPQALVQGIGNDRTGNSNNQAKFFNTRLSMITSRQIAERVMRNLKLSEWSELVGVEDPVAELLGWIRVEPVASSNLVDVSVEGTDPNLAAKIVNTTVEEFIRYEQQGLQQIDQQGRRQLQSGLRGLEGFINQAQQHIHEFHKINANFLFTGESIAAAKLTILEEEKAHAQLRLEAAKIALERFIEMEQNGKPYLSQAAQQQAYLLREQVMQLDEQLDHQKGRMNPEIFAQDSYIQAMQKRREDLIHALGEIGKEDVAIERERFEQEVEFAARDLERIGELADEQRQIVLMEQGDANRLDTLKSESTRLQDMADFMARKQLEMDIQQGLIAPRIQVIDQARTPATAIRPRVPLQIGLFIVGGLALGIGLVLLLELADGKIRKPEHAHLALGLPVLGVVPKLPRRKLLGRGGRLLAASEAPGTLACEAFRNLRMGILGAEAEEPLRSILVASAKTHEGKSLLAANLAATCARAGESVCLIDVDLRKPSVAMLFGIASDAPGLTEVLEGTTSWTRAMVDAEIPNLSVLPAGDTADVPLDILGTIEMHDLLNELQEKFDRVILDGPALLGLADSRAVARFVDGVLVVVQAGKHTSDPLARVRQLCDHEQLRTVGIAFNGPRERCDDLAGLPGRRVRKPNRPLPKKSQPQEAAA